MRYSHQFLVGLASALVGMPVARAQMGPGPMGPMGGGPGMGGPQQPAGEEKKEGVAVEAPKTPGLLPTTPALPPPKSHRKKYKLLELEGYYRVRMDWFKDFNLGFDDTTGLGGAPFPRALGCGATTQVGHPCNDSIGGENMRLRLEPTINIDEGTAVHIQADALDNYILGSTPYDLSMAGIYNTTNLPPLGAFSQSQGPITQGVNSTQPSLIVKRAWGEVNLPLGVLKFGRMPNQWGMGIWANAGGKDEINGTYNYDADYGDSVDRVSFTAGIPGTPLRAMVAFDWDWTGLSSNQTSANKGNEGHPFDMDDSDDTTSWVVVVDKLDTPQDFRDTIDRGEVAANYGVYFEYKTQGWDDNLTGFTLGDTFDSLDHYVPRDFTLYTTSLWGKLGIGSHLFETELVGQLGSLNRAQDLTNSLNELSIRKFGGAARWTFRAFEDKFHAGLESGFATGDQWDNTPQGNTNLAYANLLGGPGATQLTAFFFNRDYQVDMILWRHLYGAVTNAAYFKPFLSYDLTKSIGFSVANISSLALDPVSTPGNSTFYGTEFDTSLSYHTDRMIATIAYGVLFPFGAMSHPADTDANGNSLGGPGFGYGTNPATMTPNTGDPSAAHYINVRMVLIF